MDRRRTPQIQASGEGAGLTCRRSPRLHPQIHASGDGAGVARRRSPRLHPRIETSNDGAGVTPRRRRTSPAAAASLPDDDDMMREILLRLPPQPSSLPRASAVCKRWRRLVTDPKFHRMFYAHHRKPPLLGFFNDGLQGIVFNPVLDPPDRIPPQRFSLERYSCRSTYQFLDCRHGLALVIDWIRKELIVCDPISDEQRRVAIPPGLTRGYLKGAVLCAAGDQGHVHGGCHSSPFKVVLMSTSTNDNQHAARVYSSETGIWGDLVSTEDPVRISGRVAVLVGNCLYWLSVGGDILVFDLGQQSLTVIRGPPGTNNIISSYCQIIQAEDGALGFAILSYPRIEMWQRNLNGHGAATWVSWKTVEIHSVLELPPQTVEWVGRTQYILAYAEDTGVIFICVDGNLCMVQLKSMQSKRLPGTHCLSYYHPFTSFYTPGTAIDGGSVGAEILHNT